MADKLVYWLLGLAVIDAIIPLPITGAIVIYALIRKPRWFWTLCAEIVADTPPPPAT